MSAKTPRRLPAVGGRTGVQKLDLQTFARRLRAALDDKGMSQSDLARAVWGETTDKRGSKVAKNRDRVSQYLAGVSYPEPQNLAAICAVLGMKQEELAPDMVAATVDREDPAIQMTVVGGHLDKVYLRVNTLVSLEGAANVINILKSDPVVVKTTS